MRKSGNLDALKKVYAVRWRERIRGVLGSVG